MNCLICGKIGRYVEHQSDIDHGERHVPLLCCSGITYDCCNREIWVHMNKQPNCVSDSFDCESMIDQKWTESHQKGLCVICGKRMQYSTVEKVAMGLLMTGAMFAIGRMFSSSWITSSLIGGCIMGTALFCVAFDRGIDLIVGHS